MLACLTNSGAGAKTRVSVSTDSILDDDMKRLPFGWTRPAGEIKSQIQSLVKHPPAMTSIRQADLVQSVADALQFISYYHPRDYIQALGRAYDREQSAAA